MTPTNRKLILTCRDGVERDSYELSIPNVMDLAVEDFKLGNIIFNISVFARENCPANVIERLRGSQAFGDKEKLLTILFSDDNTDCIVLHVDGMYGCQIFAVAECSLEEVRIQKLAV